MTSEGSARDGVQNALAELLTAPADASWQELNQLAERLLAEHGSELLARLTLMTRAAVMSQALKPGGHYERLVGRLVEAARSPS